MISQTINSLIKRLCIYVSMVSVLLSGTLLAQTQIEEIIVTAQKREQSLNDVGLSVTALTGDNIRELGAFQPQDLANFTPNLNINNTFGNSIPNISIRGLGLNDYAVNNNPAVGIYTDEVYLVSPGMLSFQLFDMERVEILKGPQGTLYGRNTNAGAINFVSTKPSEDTSGYVSSGYGRFNRFDLEGAVGGELSPGLTGRVAVQTTQQNEGHQFNRATGQDVGAVERTAWRGLLNWEASDQLNILLNIHGGEDDSDTYLLKVDNAFTIDDDAFFPGDPFSSAGRPDTFMEIKSSGASLSIDWAISDSLSFKSISAYEDYSRHHVEDRDGTGRQYLDGEFINDIEQYSQEIGFTYTEDSFLLTAGAYYGHDEVVTRDNFVAVDLVGALGFFSLGNQYAQETDSFAIYLHSEWLLSDDWNLTAGARYTTEDKEFTDAFTFFTPAANGLQASTADIMIFPPVNNNRDFTDVSGKLGLDYKGIENVLLYANISKGFKSGGFQGQLTFNPADLDGFDEEDVIAYELGFKGQYLDNSMQLNGAIFLYDYTDIQLYGSLFEGPPGVGPLFGIRNIGDADVYGAEIDMLWKPVEGLDIRMGLGLLDTEITSLNDPLILVQEGSDLPNSPDVNFNANIKYEWPVSDSLSANLSLGTNYKGETIYDIVRQPVDTIEEGYWLIDVRGGINSRTSNWGIHIWVKNLADENYRSQVLTSSVGFGETYGLPRTYGLTIDYTF